MALVIGHILVTIWPITSAVYSDVKLNDIIDDSKPLSPYWVLVGVGDAARGC